MLCTPSWSKERPPPIPSVASGTFTPSLGIDDGFDIWLTQKLRSERAAFLAEIQQNLAHHLECHRKALLAEVMMGLPGIHEHGPPLVGDSATASPTMIDMTGPKVVYDQSMRSSQAGQVSAKNSDAKDITEPPKDLQKQEQKRTYQSKRIQELVDDFNAAENEGRQISMMEKIVDSNAFEIISIAAIMLNTAVLALQVQYEGLDAGYKLKHMAFNRPADDAWPGARTIFRVFNYLFTVVFILELLTRILVLKRKAFKNGWIWLDTILVMLGLLDLVLSGTNAQSGVDPTVFRMLRIVKIVRMAKLVRKLKTFDSLLLLIKSLSASANALLWSFLLLVMVQIAVGISLAQILSGHINNEKNPLEGRREVFSLFGTFTLTMVTMFESTVGNWIPPCRVLMEYVSEAYGMFYILYRCMFCFALVNVIRAVFITETSRVAQADDAVAMLKKERMAEEYSEKLKDLFNELDDSGDGLITWHEFSQLLEDDVLKKYVSTLDLEVSDLAQLFKLLDDGDGAISAEEFCKGVARVKGPARSIDVVSLGNMVKRLDNKVTDLALRPSSSSCKAQA